MKFQVVPLQGKKLLRVKIGVGHYGPPPGIIGLKGCLMYSLDLINALLHMHSLGILHNDLHYNNIMIHPVSRNLKVIDFGKATLKTCPMVYNITPGSEKQDRYNKYHRHLAYELRNVPGSCQSELTDTYSIGYVIKYIGHYENIKGLFDIGRCLKAPNPENRTTFMNAMKRIKALYKDHIPVRTM